MPANPTISAAQADWDDQHRNHELAPKEADTAEHRNPRVPNLVKGKVVPSTIQMWGETFHREANLDAYFGDMEQQLANAQGQIRQAEQAARLDEREKALEEAACVAESPPWLETDVAEAIRALKAKA